MEKKTDPRTVFVRGIDATVADAQLQEFFSDVGPVKNAFLVRRGKDGPHRGFGFVQFAVQEDAVRAAEQLNGVELAGRKLKVESAVKRAPLEERKKRKKEADAAAALAEGQQQQQAAEEAPVAPAQPPPAKKARPAKPSKPSAEALAASDLKHKWVRAVVVGGLSPEVVASAVQLAKAAGEVEEVVQPVPDKLATHFMLKRDGCTGDSFIAVYKSVKQAVEAVAKLHGQKVGGQAGAKKGGKKAQQAELPPPADCQVWARQLSGEGLHQKRWRVIVRNLPFTATEAHLRQAFAPAGFVWELTLPRSSTGRGRGFAFVGFTSKAHAERAIKLVNATKVAGRPVAVDWAVAKAQFGSAQAEAAAAAEGDNPATLTVRQQQGIDAVDSDSEDDLTGPAAKLGHEEAEGGDVAPVAPDEERRMLASVIDGLLDSEEGEEREHASADESEDGFEGGDVVGSSDDGASSGGEEEEDDEEEDDEEEEGEEEEEETAAEGPAVAAADPFSRKQLLKNVEAAGAAAASVMGQQRQRTEPEQNATVFVRGLPLDASKEQLFLKMKAYGPVRSCRLVVDKASGKIKGTAFVDFYQRASAEAVAEACAKGRRKEGPGVVVAGRPAEVDLALGQDDVRALAMSKASERGPRDNRRLALAKEGAIAEGSPAWTDMPAADRAKRKRAAEEKKLKLKSPNFSVSGTRLSVRNIPTTWTERQLKACFIAAVKERASKAQPVVKQAKILVDEARPGADGAPRSKGIGFIEFTEHEHALCALRQLNNNPDAFHKERRPIVEFALDNVKALKLHESNMARSRQSLGKQQQQQQPQQPEQAAAGPGAGAQAAAAPADGTGQQAQAGEAAQAAVSKRQLRKDRRLMLKERERQPKPGVAADGAAQPAANGTPAGDDKSRSARRRELRKRKQEGAQGAPAAAAAVAKRAPVSAGMQAKAPAPVRQPQTQQKQQQKRPGVNSSGVKAATASQQEQQARQRKRSTDDLIDKLANGLAGEGTMQLKKKSKKEQTDNVDQLAKQYVTKFFSDARAAGSKSKTARGSSGSKGAAVLQSASLKRWFD
ncbi:hypothetical protein D9Q98_000571 [Chlorella vulgaris]|uniref:RRM domain-containing protein n=1 Tax=Chlorella vulgaris TaxID=3077 RepID=A0A9D4Z1S1_CHLVU|nr:hypothetical protein D9Q98_000571 [Chlorella vulgaris]